MLVVAVAVLANGLGVGADATATGPTTQLVDAPTASDAGHEQLDKFTSGSVTPIFARAISPSLETVNL